jgi:hypothetical protein
VSTWVVLNRLQSQSQCDADIRRREELPSDQEHEGYFHAERFRQDHEEIPQKHHPNRDTQI